MAVKRVTPAERARSLHWWREEGHVLAPKDEAFLKVYELKEKERLARKERRGRVALDKTLAKAKREGRRVTTAEMDAALVPATPPTRKGRRIPLEIHEARAALDLSLMEDRGVESVAYAKALALGSFPRLPSEKREVVNFTKIGSTDWISITYTATQKGVDLPYGSDILAVFALVNAVRNEPGRTRFDFGSMADLVVHLGAKSTGGAQAEIAVERLNRVAGALISVNWFGCEADARAGKNPTRCAKFNFIREWELGATPFLGVSKDFVDHIQEAGNLLHVPVEVIRALSGFPLALQVFLLVQVRCLGTRHQWEMSFEEVVALLHEGGGRKRDLVRDVATALQLIHAVTGNRLDVTLVPFTDQRPIGRGRPGKRWALQFRPSQPLTRKNRPTLH